MRLEFTTESGAVYVLDKELMTWSRGGNSTYNLRSTEGKLLEWPKVEVGKPVEMWGPPFRKGAAIRLIFTTPVISIKELSETVQ